MELRICCDASVKLEKMSNVMEVFCDVGEYHIEDDTLNGDIVIKGKYIKDVIDEEYDFEEIVPFTLVFGEDRYEVINIKVHDFTCQEIINNGIECNFNIIVSYQKQSELSNIRGENVIEKQIKEIIKLPLKEDFIEKDIQEEKLNNSVVEEENNDIDLIEELKFEDLTDNSIKDEICKKYDNLLNEILESRADENFFEKKDNVFLRSENDNSDCRSLLNNMPSNSETLKIYYTTKESDIERISKIEKVSIDKIYNTNKSTDFINKRRIIIK